jgi:hypothetical protein
MSSRHDDDQRDHAEVRLALVDALQVRCWH